ncbi:MAG: type II secretion system protein GspJ [Chromatiales bacterium 21-64-14]|nr:MAG: type II secretion system protein GspJ [Chromatiales bacterium 21-64-14]HQU14848.1 type II secretion system minor pseudopilin GspJ [Gammaproteobacteria bacterium]
MSRWSTIRDPAGTGFTLLEMLVAIAVFAVVAALAYGGLLSVLHTRQETDLRMQQLTELQMAYLQLERDLQQAVPRTIRDELGSTVAAFLGGAGTATLFEETRGGRSNPAGLPRSSLERVAYRLKGDTLIRSTWAELDRAPGATPQDADVLHGVHTAEIRFLDAQQVWQPSWPPAGLLAAPGAAPLPRAVEVVLDLKQWGRIRWLFLLPN